ncbi:MAG: YjgN family protein [Gammaproteobacteria bacterium]|nr:YjgN family protein [Gammaproteobacteria bacterium]
METNDIARDAQQQPVTAAPASAQPEPQVHAFEFRGATAEYFKIWLVNVLLSIVTLGLYSPWATVRTRRYFHGNTVLAGARFDYHANPRSILVARIILVVFIVGGSIIAGDDALRAGAYSSLVFILLPWAMARGFAFNARNASYRGIRFDFARRYRRLYLIFAPAIAAVVASNAFVAAHALQPQSEAWNPWGTTVLLCAAAVVLFVSAPFTARAYHRFKAEQHRLGRAAFMFRTPKLRMYMCALWLIPLCALALFAGIAWVFLSAAWLHAMLGMDDAVAAYIILLALALIIAYLLLTSLLFQLYWRGVSAKQSRIVCSVSVWRFALSIRFVNLIASLLTLGLAIPWARIRRAKYLAAHLAVEVDAQALDSLVADAAPPDGAFGEALAASEGFDFDVGLI